MSGALALVLALVLLGLTLGAAMARVSRLPEAVVAMVGALLVVVTGGLSARQAADALRELGPTVGFLAALLLIAEGCRRAGLFELFGDVIAERCRGQPRRLLGLVFLVACGVTIILGLDATVVLLPPIVLVTVRSQRADPRAPLYACVHLANSASLLLPVSNLTNLLAFRASGLSFVHFGLLMALATAAAIGVEWVVISRRFGVAAAPPSAVAASPPEAAGPAAVAADRVAAAPGRGPARTVPRFAVVVLALTLVGFAVSSLLQIAPVWIAVAGAVVLNLGALRGGRGALGQLVSAAEPGFLVFVLGLGVIVAAASQHGLGSAVNQLLPYGATLPDLLLIAALSAVLANLVNNLPATLILIPVAAGLGTGPLLAVLIGVNIGPNLTPVGSLATLLWRRVLSASGVDLPMREFVGLGVLSVPAGLVLATIGMWLTLRLGV